MTARHDEGASIVWFRQDLRLTDHPPLQAARRKGGVVLPVYLWSPEEEGDWPPGAASRWWLHQSLRSLDQALKRCGSRLLLRRGPALPALRQLVRETGASAIFWTRRYEPAAIAQAEAVRRGLREDGLAIGEFNSNLLHSPEEIRTGAGDPYKVFTPFWRALQSRGDPEAPAPGIRALPAPRRWPRSEGLGSFRLEPTVDWAGGIREAWSPGERGARRALDRFLKRIETYPADRDRPDLPGTSSLSPHLHFGEIGPRQVWHEVRRHASTHTRRGLVTGSEAFLRQLVWREFAHHLLHAFPLTPLEPLRAEFHRFPWSVDRGGLRAWTRGSTGYPIVDAGLRELWATGWMHNRVRMIAASFLVKDLMIPWQEGARWFWDTLVDADLANNTLGWQWTAGCGADAAPYFRIFNPVTQGGKFDPHGIYVRHWIPELSKLSDRFLHHPWDAPAEELSAAGVHLGEVYPRPIVDHKAAREQALAGYAAIRGE